MATFNEMLNKISDQQKEIETLKAQLEARPTEMALFAATQNAEYYRNLFVQKEADLKRVQKQLKNKRRAVDFERGYSEFLEAKYSEG